MNKTADYKLTIVVPVYNEEDNIYALEERLSKFISQSSQFPACVLFVNDGSKDKSRERIEEVCSRQNGFFFLNLAKNGGLSTAVKAGIDAAFSQFTGYIDADLQTAPEDFNLLIPHVNDYEMVMGIRANRKDSFVKGMSSKIANGFRRFMTKDGIEDTGCPLKIIRTDYAKRIPLFTGMHRFLPALIMLQNGTVKQVPVQHFPRVAGVSKYNLANRLVGPFIDCFAYRWMKKRYINYSVADNNLN
ncbi:MAG: glycosyltransferase family 2 protein [Bacteroidales bacterium]|jgi:glycosyltransferase involved in cell wall biosynthesis|nr:glycosyltransferase family 2 protein [Bacteroidales bacterium]NTV19066.1 glycosyltransferase family 2 protein [Bacteroidales bacterium]HPS95871.1 glycosyltransferase family 2 protein [Bacteroidales bacterium]